MPIDSLNGDVAPEPRRASLERLRAVGQTFTESIAAFRDRVISVSTKNSEEDIIEHSQADKRDETMSSSELTIHDEAIPRKESSAAIVQQLTSLRAENESLQASLNRTSRLLANSRAENEKLHQKVSQESNRANVAVADVARLRTQIVQFEHENRHLNKRIELADTHLIEERKKTAALERVCMALRRRAAIAETHAEDAKKMKEAVIAKEVAETSLAEARAEAEKWRVKSTATDVLRERAEAAERSEKIQRDKIDMLERELESRESLLRQNLIERRKLKEYMAKYERELEEKERKIAKMKRSMKRPSTKNRRVEVNTRSIDDIDDAILSTNGTEFESIASQTVEKDASIDFDTGSRDWERDAIVQSLHSIERDLRPNDAVSLAEASPLVRDVEEAHAQLQAIFRDDTNEDGRSVVDLLERVRRLEASFGALAETRVQSRRRTGSV